jgi:uncharacterized membrane protein
MQVTKTITILRQPHEVYEFWRDFENLPRFMYHLEHVETIGSGRSHWIAKAPGGGTVEWDAELIEDRPNEFIAWRSVGADDDVRNSGAVRFTPAPGERGTEVRVDLQYDPPGGSLGARVAKLFGEEPGQQMADDLRRFKQVMELGEVIRSAGSPEGVGQGVMRQRPSQPSEHEARP